MGDTPQNPVTAPASPSNATAVKEAFILSRHVSDTTENWARSTVALPKSILAIDESKGVIKIGENKPFSQTRNHSHNDQYSPIAHSHYFGYGEKWFRSCPRLWLTSDLINHPELIPLNGQELSEELAFYLSEIYSSITSIAPVASSMETDEYRILMSNSNPLCLPYKAFNNGIGLNNLLDTTDQWLTGTTGIDTPEWLRLDFKDNSTYILHSYAIVARCGTPSSPYAEAASPKSWIVEVSSGDGNWVTVSDVTVPNDWSPNEVRYFDLPVPSAASSQFRLTITEWWIPEGALTELGIRRWYLSGKKIGSFNIPYLPSPHPEFTYVVPVNDIGIGMKHEEVGDVGYSVTREPLIPINRIILDGREVDIADEPWLYGVCGQKYAPVVVPASSPFINLSGSTGATATPFSTIVSFQDKLILGSYAISSNGIYPSSWTLYSVDLDDVSYQVGEIVINPTDSRVLESDWLAIDTVTDGIHTSPVTRDLYHNTFDREHYKLVITKWMDNSSDIGTLDLTFYGSTTGKFRVPDKRDEAPEGMIPYVVSRVRTEDINSSVVLELQNALLSTQQQLATMLDRLIRTETELTNLRAEIISNP